MSSDREKILENALAQFIKPIKGIPFEVIIKSLFEVEVRKFEIGLKGNQELLTSIVSAMRSACMVVQAGPIERYRPNEVGNDMEPFVIKALTDSGLVAANPKTKTGKGKATAYPDTKIKAKAGTIFLEVKSYAKENHNTTQRSFYLSPSDDPKVFEDAHHLVVGFEIEDKGANGKKDSRGRELRDYVPVGFILVDLYGLDCDMKSEFNSDNKRLYAPERVLAQERVINI